ncbi:MAG TPA: WG repeat-containing protein [Hanamia sp.]
MNYCFTTLTTTILCLFLIVFAGKSHAQYNSVYDSKGNVKSVETRRYEESRNSQNKILNSNSPSYKSPATESSESSSDKWLRELRKAEAEKRVAEAKEAARNYPYIEGSLDINGLYWIKSTLTELYGYRDSKNNLMIPISYSDYKFSTEGYYALKRDNRWGFLDKTGKVMIPFKYEEVHKTFEKGIARVELNHRILWIDKNGNEISDEKVKAMESNARFALYSYVAPTTDENGLRLAIKKGAKTYYSYLNDDNIEVIGGDVYIDYKPLSEGYYALKYDTRSSTVHYPFWVFVDKENHRLKNEWYGDIISTFKNGLANVRLYVPRSENGRAGTTVWIDKKGNEVIVTPPSLLAPGS